MNLKKELFAPVVASYTFPPCADRAGPERMGKFGEGLVQDLAVAPQPMAQLSVFGIEEESLIKEFDRPDHQAGTHDLVNLCRLALGEATCHPIGTEDSRSRDGFLQEELLAGNRPQCQGVATGVLKRSIWKRKPSPSRHDPLVLEHFGKQVDRARLRDCIRVQKEGQLAIHCRETLVVRGTKSTIHFVFDELNPGELPADHRDRAIAARVVYDDHLITLVPQGSQSRPDVGYCVVTDKDHRDLMHQPFDT